MRIRIVDTSCLSFVKQTMRHTSLLLLVIAFSCQLFAEDITTDLLIVGGNESACAAAVQACRLGVKKVVLVNDIDWLGGQFSAEGVGCLDEWTTVNGKRVNFPRSGLFAEMVQRIRAFNSAKYGKPDPGNAYCGTQTIEPAAAAQLFEVLLLPHVQSGVLRIERYWEPTEVTVHENQIQGVSFASTQHPEKLVVQAKLTIDASDWGDIIRLSGAKYGAGPDLRSRFQEPSAPETYDAAGQQEMNPLSWCLVLREAGKDCTIAQPAQYDARSFAALDKTPPWVESDMSSGIYSQSGWSIYTHRRLVDRWHNGFTVGTEATFLNWPVQDYPLCQLPQHVCNALEATESGASKKNIVAMTPAQRKIIFADAKQHALGMLYHLQTRVHERVGDFPQSFRYMQLTNEFGTPDNLPPKPYVREGLRLEALTMLTETDIRSTHKEPLWAKVMPSDSILGFQFNIDFHPTRRKFLTDNRSGAWQYIHTPTRGWHTDTDRATFPLRGLIPREMQGLLGAGKNIGVSSVVQSALRLHNQTMLIGQASGTLAAFALRAKVQPRAIAANWQHMRQIQQTLVRGHGGPGLLLWPWHDIIPDDIHFEAANLLAVRNIWLPDAHSVFFQPEKIVTRGELAGALARLHRATNLAKEWPKYAEAKYSDLAAPSLTRYYAEAITSWGDFGTQQIQFEPTQEVTWETLHKWMSALKLPVSVGLLENNRKQFKLTRGECVQHLWRALQLAGEHFPASLENTTQFSDPLPFDSDNNNLPDRLQPPMDTK
jgi:FAD dependent oxidoreductase